MNDAKTVTLSTADWQIIVDSLNLVRDEGPEGNGWQSDELMRAHLSLSSALAVKSSCSTNQELASLIRQGDAAAQTEAIARLIEALPDQSRSLPVGIGPPFVVTVDWIKHPILP